MPRLSEAEQSALARAGEHPRHRIDANPRTVRSLLAKNLAKITYYGENADGPWYVAVLRDEDDDES